MARAETPSFPISRGNFARYFRVQSERANRCTRSCPSTSIVASYPGSLPVRGQGAWVRGYIDCIFQLRRSLRYIESNNSKKRSQYGKYTPEQKAMIGKRAAEHGVVANLCITDHFILVVTSYHSFHFETLEPLLYACTRGVV